LLGLPLVFAGGLRGVPDLAPLVQAKTANRLENHAMPRRKSLGPRAAEIKEGPASGA